MSQRRTSEEKLASLDERIAQLLAQKEEEQARLDEAAEKARHNAECVIGRLAHGGPRPSGTCHRGQRRGARALRDRRAQRERDRQAHEGVRARVQGCAGGAAVRPRGHRREPVSALAPVRVSDFCSHPEAHLGPFVPSHAVHGGVGRCMPTRHGTLRSRPLIYA